MTQNHIGQTAPEPSDQEIVAGIRKEMARLNESLRIAANAGIDVDFDIVEQCNLAHPSKLTRLEAVFRRVL